MLEIFLRNLAGVKDSFLSVNLIRGAIFGESVFKNSSKLSSLNFSSSFSYFVKYSCISSIWFSFLISFKASSWESSNFYSFSSEILSLFSKLAFRSSSFFFLLSNSYFAFSSSDFFWLSEFSDKSFRFNFLLKFRLLIFSCSSKALSEDCSKFK